MTTRRVSRRYFGNNGDSGQTSAPSLSQQKSFANWKTLRGVSKQTHTPSLSAPVFKKRNNSFSSSDHPEDLLLHYFQRTMSSILSCVGMESIQIRNILAQIDFLLSDSQHQYLQFAKVLKETDVEKLEVIYKETRELIDSQTEKKAAIKIQSQVRGFFVRKRISKLRKEEKSVFRIRSSIFQELVRTEKAYLDTLEDTMQEYVRPIRRTADKHNLGAAAVKYLVGNLESLLGYHQVFYDKLDKIRDHKLYPLVLPLGELVQEESANLRTVYMAYFNSFIPRMETLTHLRNTVPRFHSLITEKEQNSECLEELFELPLQYLCVLSAKLRSIHSCSIPVIEKETFLLGRSIGIVESIDLASRKILDEQQFPEAYENISKILLAELTLEGLEEPLLGTPNLKLIKSGSVRIHKRKNLCHMYLFNDVIIIAEKIVNTNKYSVIRKIYAKQLTISEKSSKIYLHIAVSNQEITEILLFKNNRSDKADWLAQLREFVECYQSNCVYGIPIEEIIERECIEEKIPFVMAITMKYIREYGLTTEGIFRVPGDSFVIETFQRLFDSGATEVDFRGCSVHDVAALLKLYFRKLPESLIPSKFYDALIKAQTDFDREHNEEKLVLDLATVVKDLTSCQRHVLKKLIDFLSELIVHHKSTKMNVENIAMVFAPNIVRPKEYTVDSAMQSELVSKIFRFFIENYTMLVQKATELDPMVAIQFEWGNETAARKNLLMLQKASPRYSMDAFDPLLCNEIPLPETLDSPSAKLRLPLKKSKQKKIAKKKFSRKVSPRHDRPEESSDEPSSLSATPRTPGRSGLDNSLEETPLEVEIIDYSFGPQTEEPRNSKYLEKDLENTASPPRLNLVRKQRSEFVEGTEKLKVESLSLRLDEIVSSPKEKKRIKKEKPSDMENEKSEREASGIILRNEQARRKRKKAYKMKYANDTQNTRGDSASADLTNEKKRNSALWSLISPRNSKKQ